MLRRRAVHDSHPKSRRMRVLRHGTRDSSVMKSGAGAGSLGSDRREDIRARRLCLILFHINEHFDGTSEVG